MRNLGDNFKELWMLELYVKYDSLKIFSNKKDIKETPEVFY